MTILLISFAPVLLILLYVYYRDKYEKEPLKVLFKALAAGAIIVIPVMFIEVGLDKIVHIEDKIANAFYQGFAVAGFTEELFKFLAFYLIIWKNKNFNEPFDGIIYAVFISLGFAAVENLFYVIEGGGGVAALRAFTAVPAHTFFGITMGYYFGFGRFKEELSSKFLWLALIVPMILHGFYDFFLMSENGWLMLTFVPFFVYLWIAGFKKMRKLSDASKLLINPIDQEIKDINS